MTQMTDENVALLFRSDYYGGFHGLAGVFRSPEAAKEAAQKAVEALSKAAGPIRWDDTGEGFEAILAGGLDTNMRIEIWKVQNG